MSPFAPMLVLLLAAAACAPQPSTSAPASPPPRGAAPALTPEQREQAACGAAEEELVAAFHSLEPSGEVSGRASAVEITGTRHLDRARLARQLETKAGAELSSELLRADAERLFALGGVEDVRVELTPGSGGSVVRFVVVEHPELARVFVRVPPDLPIPPGTWPKPGDAFSAAPLSRLLGELRETLARQGYLRASATMRGRRLDDGRVDLCLGLERGPKILVETVDIAGATGIPVAELAGLRETRDGTTNVPGGLLEEDLLELDALRMNALYYDRGMIEAKVSHQAAISDSGVKIAFKISEGPVYRIGSISVEGDLVTTRAAYQRRIRSKKGEVFSRARLLEDIERIDALHGEQRAKGLEVVPATEIDAVKREVQVKLRVRRPSAPADGR